MKDQITPHGLNLLKAIAHELLIYNEMLRMGKHNQRSAIVDTLNARYPKENIKLYPLCQELGYVCRKCPINWSNDPSVKINCNDPKSVYHEYLRTPDHDKEKQDALLHSVIDLMIAELMKMTGQA